MDSRMTSSPGALKQLLAAITPLGEDAFRHRCKLLPGGTVGGHVRHCIEFYQCLFEGIGAGEVNYDGRRRNADIESCPQIACQTIQHILSTDWERIESLPHDLPLLVKESLQGRQQSSLGRELGFAFSHTIHHLALIGMLLRDHGRAVADEIGLAPSTARHFTQQTAG